MLTLHLVKRFSAQMRDVRLLSLRHPSVKAGLKAWLARFLFFRRPFDKSGYVPRARCWLARTIAGGPG
jgi:hypothetical protein